MTHHKQFRQQINSLMSRSKGKRRWIFVPHDQLSDSIGPLSREDPSTVGIVLIESRWWASRRPHHRQKLALVWANQRHFALEQARRGVAVRFEPTRRPFRAKLLDLISEVGPLETMEPAERELRTDIAPLVAEGLLQLLPHEGWLTTPDDFDKARTRSPHWFMDAFYKAVRRRTGILMDGTKPVGGQFSFDADNRQSWKGQPPPPVPPVFEPDAITREVAEMILSDYAHHPGELDLAALPATLDDAHAMWDWVKHEVLEHFGPFEDAMTLQSSGLFHTRLSGLINIHRLCPATIVEEVEHLDIPLSSKEGFIRQVIGWREFVKHVHDATDGFRSLPGNEKPDVAATPGDGGWSAWTGKKWPGTAAPDHTYEDAHRDIDGGAAPSLLKTTMPIPAAYWGQPSGMTCLDTVVADVWREGWSHHITRLMILSNIATLLGVSPRDLTDWFWVAYVDAWDWVVEPNVLGMGTFAVGEVMTTKPYVSGSAYISKMSDYCPACAFDPKTNCPIAAMYWAFLDRNREHLDGNPRLAMPMRSLAKRAPQKREADARIHETAVRKLSAGEKLVPGDFAK